MIEEVKLPQNGQWSASLQAIEPGEYTVTEIAQEQNNYRLGHTFLSRGTGKSDRMTAQIDVAKEQTVTVTYTNQYQPLMVVSDRSREQDVSYNPDRNSRRNRRRVFSVSSKKRGKKKIHEIKRGEIHLF